jgi:hypothetical protein
MAKRKVQKRAKKETNTNKNTNKNKNVINIKIHNNSKKRRSKSKSGQSKSSGQSTLAPYSSFNPTIYFPQPNYPMPNYQQQMVGSGYRDAVNPTQNTRMDFSIPESIANPQSQTQETMYNPYSNPIYSNPIGKSLPSLLSNSTKSLPDSDETVNQVGSYSSMSSYPFSNPSALFETEKFNIDNSAKPMSEASFPIYSVFDEPAFNENSKVEYENPMELKKKREAKDAKKINNINKEYYKSLAMDELLKSMPENEINNMKFTKGGTPKLNSKYGKKYNEILKRIMDEDKK